MNDPHSEEIPFFPSPLQTVFFTEGSQLAIVVSNRNGRYRRRVVRVANAEDALAWAKKKQASMVYVPNVPKIDQN